MGQAPPAFTRSATRGGACCRVWKLACYFRHSTVYRPICLHDHWRLYLSSRASRLTCVAADKALRMAAAAPPLLFHALPLNFGVIQQWDAWRRGAKVSVRRTPGGFVTPRTMRQGRRSDRSM